MSLFAIAVFQDKIKGTVLFSQTPFQQTMREVTLRIQLQGLGKNRKRGFHIHQFGDLSDGCTSMCAHFNPQNQHHGGPLSKIRHAGDLGNVISDSNGNANYEIVIQGVTLKPSKFSIIGRGLIIHEDEDDLGLGGHSDSLVTGHAGKRSACAVIGWSSLNKDGC
jgi:Cu-Zn family superoxide dismutase